MALWSSIEGGTYTTVTASTAASTAAVTVTASATPHTKGSWVELVSSAAGSDELMLWLRDLTATGATDTSILLDIGFGASSSEVVQVANIYAGHAFGNGVLKLPLQVPSGTRVAARIQSAVVSKQLPLGCALGGSTGWLPGRTCRIATTYGADTATSNGTAITAPGSNNTKGAWTEITSSTTRPIRLMLPQLTIAPADTSTTFTHALYDIGVGASSSEVAVVSNLPAVPDSNEALRHLNPLIPVNIPSGVRLSARLQKAGQLTDIHHAIILGFD